MGQRKPTEVNGDLRPVLRENLALYASEVGKADAGLTLRQTGPIAAADRDGPIEAAAVRAAADQGRDRAVVRGRRWAIRRITVAW
jgi:hypothetical protein